MDTLEEEARKLLDEGRKLEAVRLVHKAKGCSLLEAKLYIDRIEKGTDNRDRLQNIRGWNVKWRDGKVEEITVYNAFGTHTAEPGSPEWMSILQEVMQEGHGRIGFDVPEKKKSLWERFFQSRWSGVAAWTALAVMLMLIILFIYPSYFGLHTREAYWGLTLHIVMYIAMIGLMFNCYRIAQDRREKWYSRLALGVMGTAFMFAIIGLGHDLALDLIENDVRSYEGIFRLRTVTHHNRSADYTVTWEGDTLSDKRFHNISYAHFKQLREYRTVRITYWRHTGLVWKLEPLEKK